MSFALRVLLIVAAVVMVVSLLLSIRKSKMRIEDSISWIVLAFLILILSIVPQLASELAYLLGFQAPVNFVYLFLIVVLLVKCFRMSQRASELETRVRELTQQIAVDKLGHYERKAEITEAASPANGSESAPPSGRLEQSEKRGVEGAFAGTQQAN